jgi:predicted DNA-binding transcriptional regulator YafY
MEPMEVIVTEARAHRTVVLTARESDGSFEVREIEPYSLRPGAKDRPEVRLYYYCLKKHGIRNTYLSNVISAKPTGRSFAPRWPVEF